MESPDIQGDQSIYVLTDDGETALLKNGNPTELNNATGLVFTRVTCYSNDLWAISSDGTIYLRAESSALVREESYENQRWYPSTGFSSQLLPSDRYQFSSQDGRTNREFASIELPSKLWAWDDSWHLELMHEGTQLAEEGWTYAFDFVWSFSPSMSRNSYVRRRKWVRNRRYIASGQWAPLPNSLLDSFIDIAVGGENLPGAPPGFASLWAITSDGSLFYRDGVNTKTCPEGVEWLKIETPQPLSRVSTSPKGNIWILAQNGQLFTRKGISSSTVTGDNWQEIPLSKESVPSFDFIGGIIDSFDSFSDSSDSSSKLDAFKAAIEKNKKAIITGTIAAGVSGVVVAVAAPVLIPAALGTVGFTSGGVAAGSMAAAVQSTIGNVAAGSLFALCQSVGAAGIASSTAVGLGAGASVVGGVVAGAVAANTNNGNEESSNEETNADTQANKTAPESQQSTEQRKEVENVFPVIKQEMPEKIE